MYKVVGLMLDAVLALVVAGIELPASNKAFSAVWSAAEFAAVAQSATAWSKPGSSGRSPRYECSALFRFDGIACVWLAGGPMGGPVCPHSSQHPEPGAQPMRLTFVGI